MPSGGLGIGKPDSRTNPLTYFHSRGQKNTNAKRAETSTEESNPQSLIPRLRISPTLRSLTIWCLLVVADCAVMRPHPKTPLPEGEGSCQPRPLNPEPRPLFPASDRYACARKRANAWYGRRKSLRRKDLKNKEPLSACGYWV